MVPRTGLGYFFECFLIFSIDSCAHCLGIFFRQIGYNKENIMWAMSTLLWLALLLFMTQLSADDYEK